MPGLPWIYAAGAVVWLVYLAQAAGYLAARPFREQLAKQIAKMGYEGQAAAVLFWTQAAGSLLIAAVAAGVHAVAFYGLRGRRRWGWLAAVLVAGAWSLLLVGIPVLALLLRRSTRRAYGVS